jgi:cytochrome c oxidase subunit 2
VGGSAERSAEDVSPSPVRKLRRVAVTAAALSLVGLAGCSAQTVEQFKRLGLPEAASDRAPYMHNLWIGTWIAAGAIGIFMWAVILWAALRYKTKHNEMPTQNRYNLPMEIFYTIAPFIIIGVLFYYTVLAQNGMLRKVADPDVEILVVGQKWSWTFNYKAADNPAVGSDVYEAGTINKTPTLYLPVNKSVRFVLNSPDVIHSFWIPSFYQKLDVVPGRNNSFDVVPNKEGHYFGKCAELCGTYHSAMLFNVEVVSEDEYNTYLKSLVAKGQVGQARGPANANVPAQANARGPQEAEKR